MDHANPTERKSVAVVEGDPAVRSSLKFSLETDGFRVHAFALARDFLSAVPALHIDCLIVDHRLHDMTGLDLIDRLRSESRDFPAIIIAGQPGKSLRQHAEQRHIIVVEKPLVGDTLTDSVRQLLA